MSTSIDPTYVKANFPTLRPEWLALHTEAVIESSLPVVDAHHHLWDLPGFVYLRDEFLADVDTGHNIRSSVYIDCKARYRTEGPESLRPVGETEFVVAETPNATDQGFVPCAAIVGWADLQLGDHIEPVLEAHVEAGQGRFRGIRTRATWHGDGMLHPAGEGRSGLLLDSTVQRGVRRLGALGLSLDVWVFHTQLDEVAQLAAACPDTRLILDHCGGPLGIGPFAGRRDEVFSAWRDSMATLAKHDNVVIKLGGLAMPRMGFGFHEAERPPASAVLADAWAPYLKACIDAFGVERCMFESNFPVDKGGCSYTVLWNAFKRVAAECGAAEKEALFSRTAATCYRV